MNLRNFFKTLPLLAATPFTVKAFNATRSLPEPPYNREADLWGLKFKLPKVPSDLAASNCASYITSLDMKSHPFFAAFTNSGLLSIMWIRDLFTNYWIENKILSEKEIESLVLVETQDDDNCYLQSFGDWRILNKINKNIIVTCNFLSHSEPKEIILEMVLIKESRTDQTGRYI